MALARFLEDFDAPDPAEPKGPAVETLPGYEAGFAAGQQAARQAAHQLDAELVQTLTEMGFGFAEARLALLSALEPLFEALTGTLLSDLADDLFQARLVSALNEAAGRQLGQPIRLAVSPGQVEAVARLLPRVGGIALDVQPDTRLAPRSALISQGTSEEAIDLDAVLTGISQILDSVGTATREAEEIARHG